MTIRSARWIAAVLVLGASASLSADRVRLRSGKAVEGIFLGGDSKAVRVLLENGQVSEIPLEEALVVEFSARKPARPPEKPAPTPAKTAPTPAPAPAAAARPFSKPCRCSSRAR